MEGDEYQIIVLTVNSLPIYRFYNPSNKWSLLLVASSFTCHSLALAFLFLTIGTLICMWCGHSQSSIPYSAWFDRTTHSFHMFLRTFLVLPFIPIHWSALGQDMLTLHSETLLASTNPSQNKPRCDDDYCTYSRVKYKVLLSSDLNVLQSRNISRGRNASQAIRTCDTLQRCRTVRGSDAQQS